MAAIHQILKRNLQEREQTGQEQKGQDTGHAEDYSQKRYKLNITSSNPSVCSHTDYKQKGTARQESRKGLTDPLCCRTAAGQRNRKR